MITANFQRDAVHFSAPEKKSKRLLIRNYQLIYYDPQSVASIAWENVTYAPSTAAPKEEWTIRF